ncbi:MAG: B12-binding domain-containing radical SAM protein [Chloroflexi bacterium]|nr:B12-binding domain-containing radical SAM protein [Chloroflexota bacterium]
MGVKVALIQVPCPQVANDRLEPNQGLLYLATYLNYHGHEATLVDLSSTTEDTWVRLIPPADVYGFHTYTATYDTALEVARVARGVNPRAALVAGGPHVSALPQEALTHFDYVVVGEGETSLLRLVEALGKEDAPPRVLREPPVADLDSLPLPNYRLVDLDSYRRQVAGKRSLSMISSRGCPYRCTFCAGHMMGANERVRFRSPEGLVREAVYLATEMGVTNLKVNDDIFTAQLPRLRRINELLKPLNLNYRCYGEAHRCSSEVTDLLAQSGCRHISFGVESGSRKMLRLMKKPHTPAQVRAAIACAKASGLTVRAYLIVGFPGETWETVRETVELMLECCPHEYIVSAFMPYPGTPPYHHPEQFGITELDTDFSHYLQVKGNRETGYVFATRELNGDILAAMRDCIIKELSPCITWSGEAKAYSGISSTG